MINVSIIEDDQRLRLALLTCLQKAVDISVLTAVDSSSFYSSLKASGADVVIIDINLGKTSGTEEVRKIQELVPNASIIILTDFEDDDTIIRLVKAGAKGYLLKKNPPANIVDAVRRVSRGEGALSGVIAGKILKYLQQSLKLLSGLEAYQLTKREQEILGLLMDGLSYKQIAARCFVSIDTINSHIRKIYKKLAVRSRAEITARFRLK